MKQKKLSHWIRAGTGTHQFVLQNCFAWWQTVLDVGTGSGVLSIASRYLGAKDVYAYDLDELQRQRKYGFKSHCGRCSCVSQ